MDYFDEGKLFECFKAFKSLRFAGYFYGWILMLCVIIQLAGFSVVYFAKVLEPLNSGTSAIVTDQQKNDKAVKSAEFFRDSLKIIFPVTRFLALFCVCLLVATACLGSQLTMVFRSAGIRGFIDAFFWMVFLLILVIPWQKIFGTGFAAGGLFDLPEILNAMDRYAHNHSSRFSCSLVLFRFIGYPVILILVWVMGQIRFSNASGKIKQEYKEYLSQTEIKRKKQIAQKKLFPDLKE